MKRTFDLARAIKIHGNTYDYSKVVYQTWHTKVEIVCPKHGSFWKSPTNHLILKQGCSSCKTKKKIGRHTNPDLFFSKSIQVHGKKYDYSRVNYTNSSVKIEIICLVHGSFWQRPSAHSKKNGQGCPKCASEKRQRLFENKKTAIEAAFFKKAKDLYPKYNFSSSEYHGYLVPIKVECITHGHFNRTSTQLLAGLGCPRCMKRSTSILKTQDKFIEEVRSVHGEKYDYSKVVYTGRRKNIAIICSKHGEFQQTAGTHLKGSGCPKCYGSISKSCIKWLDSFNNPLIQREVRIITNDEIYRLDGYDSTTNTAYEYLGGFWHGDPRRYNPLERHPKAIKYRQNYAQSYKELYEQTMHKIRNLQKVGYNVICVWEKYENYPIIYPPLIVST